MATEWTVTFDASDPRRLADFWALALGYVDEEGYDYEEGASLVDPKVADRQSVSYECPRARSPRIDAISISDQLQETQIQYSETS